MDKKNNNFKAPENTRKTTRSGSLKSSVGSVAAENSPTPVEALQLDARIQEIKERLTLLRNQLHRNQLPRPRLVNPRLVNLKPASQELPKGKVQARIILLELWTLLLY